VNPLSVLHSILSTGIHGQSDEDCIEFAEEVRKVLEYLVNQISMIKSAKQGFTDSVKRLLDKYSDGAA